MTILERDFGLDFDTGKALAAVNEPNEPCALCERAMCECIEIVGDGLIDRETVSAVVGLRRAAGVFE